MKHVIRTSDRLTYKRCRRSWDLGSIDRQNFVPDRPAKPLEFGTAWHAGLATYYDPLTWDMVKNKKTRDVVEAYALQSFHAECDKQYAKRRDPNTGEVDLEVEEDFAERRILGEGMFKNYFQWAPLNDNFKVVAVELDFEVPILAPDGEQMICKCHGWPVYYQGRLDGLVEDLYGWYWILEHKSTGQMGDTQHLVLDEQTGSYAWAVQQMLGVRILGIIYSEALKDFPEPPKQLVSTRLGRNFSVAKNQRTTYEVYLKAITEAGEDVTLYEDILSYFREEGNPFLRRSAPHRNQNELKDIGHRIWMEATEMLDTELFIYPNPSRFNCMMCAFMQVCVSMNDGSDYGFLLEEEYRARTTEEIEARRARV